MPLVAHNGLPAFQALRDEGLFVLPPGRATHQHIRELHVGLLNMMPDKALAATERQFLRLIGESNPIAQFYVHPFTLPELQRGEEAARHIDQYYESFEQIRKDGLDALIITGATPVSKHLDQEVFWEPLKQVVSWAAEHVTSTLCSCLATHAVMQFRYGQTRRPQRRKIWGVFSHEVSDKRHPLVNDVNSRFDVPHSRWNDISADQFRQAGLHVLVQSHEAGVHLATSPDGFRFVFFQGHPEYDTISLLKEYKRDLSLFAQGKLTARPPLPMSYLKVREEAILKEYAGRLLGNGKATGAAEFPEKLVAPRLANTWHDTAEAVVGNWMGLVYQTTHWERKIPFMEGIDPNDPLGFLAGMIP